MFLHTLLKAIRNMSFLMIDWRKYNRVGWKGFENIDFVGCVNHQGQYILPGFVTLVSDQAYQ